MKELSLHILDILMNSVEAGAKTVQLNICEEIKKDLYIIEVIDDGKGMSPEMVKTVLDPFVTTRKTRKVGLGLSLLQTAAQQCGGDISIESELGKGTKVKAWFIHSHIDRAPLGDIASALMAILLAEKPVDLVYRHTRGDKEFVFDSREVKAELGNEIALSHPQVRDWIMGTLKEGEAELEGE
jgi:hypothetical protein